MAAEIQRAATAAAPIRPGKCHPTHPCPTPTQTENSSPRSPEATRPWVKASAAWTELAASTKPAMYPQQAQRPNSSTTEVDPPPPDLLNHQPRYPLHQLCPAARPRTAGVRSGRMAGLSVDDPNWRQSAVLLPAAGWCR